MPFPHNGQQQSRYDGPPPIRVTPLWTSKSGKALVGTIYVGEPRRAAQGEPASNVKMGDILIDLIKKCMAEGKPVRALVFEAKGGKFPYNLNFAEGNVAAQVPQQAGGFGARQTAPWGAEPVPLPNDDEQQDDGGEALDATPTPRPIRRGAPRR